MSPCLGLAALAFVLAATPAQARTVRAAVVVGNNVGSGLRPSLRFAEADAAKLAGVLTELGGFAPEDVQVLQGERLAAVHGALAAVAQKVARWHAEPATNVVLVFYFSGHSDGQALELGAERLAFRDLRSALAASGADVRVAIVDSCQSGALLALKGGTPGATFDIRMQDDVASTGEALLTSSAANEVALESAEIRASLFSHHLISGLRGAADLSGDGRVTLAEAYRYSFQQTLATTANTLAGPQHPAYDYRLSGQGEVVLTELLPRTASLTVPEGFARILVQEAARGQVIAEVGVGGARRLAVRPGAYQLSGFRDGRAFATTVQVVSGVEHKVRAEELHETWVMAAGSKGDEPAAALVAGAYARSDEAETRATPSAFALAAGGVRAGVARRLGPASALRLGWRPPRAGFCATLDAGAGAGPGFSEDMLFLSAGWAAALGSGRLRAHAALELGGGGVIQRVDGEDLAWTPAAGLTASLTGSYWLSRAWGLVVDAALPAMVVRRDGGNAGVLLPAITAGVAAAWR